MGNLKQLNLITLIMVGAAIIFAFMYIKTCNAVNKQRSDDVALIAALNDSVHRLNDSVSRMTVIQQNNVGDFLALKIKDEEIIALQKTVKEYKNRLKAGNSVTNFSTITTVKNTNTTKITDNNIADTIYSDTGNTKIVTITKYPTYSDSLLNKWIKYRASMNRDSSTFDLQVFSDYSVIIGVDKRKPFADIKNNNPYSETTAIRSFQVKLPRPKKFGIGLSSGVTYYSQKFQPYIGAGLNYNLIRF